MKLGIAALAGAVGIDLIGHLLGLAALQQAGHVAALLAMVATLLAVVGGSYAHAPTGDQSGDRHAVR
ncbi:MAG TPA: hypothetical protein VH813_01690 [Candidatus Limnocylindrales bacterium]|jgi:hypothetical protein